MPKFVSVPEKTLEHWSSQYITFRYRSQAALWWPARGEDIDVGSLPAKPGKAVQLELKTTTVVSPGHHEVLVDLSQLRDYRQRSPGRQPFYAFPWPDWNGELKAAAIAGGRAVTELGFTRSGPGWWFADWMVVLTAAQVAGVLDQELAAHGSKDRGPKPPLVRFDVSNSQTKATWGPRAVPSPRPIDWREFWSTFDECGRRGWPQLIRLPARLTKTRGPYPPQQITEMLREAANMPATEWENGEGLVTLEPDADGNYQITQAPADIIGVSDEDAADEDRTVEADDHRLVIFLDARTLLSKR
jgi:hypothetical protein